MSKIVVNQISEEQISNKSKYFFICLALIMGFCRMKGLLDEYHMSRFAAFTVLGILGYVFVLTKPKEFKFYILDVLFGIYLLSTYFSLFWANLPSAGYVGAQSVLLAFAFYMFFRFLGNGINQKFIFEVVGLLNIGVLAIVLKQMVVQTLSKDGLQGDFIYTIIGMSGHKNLVSSFLFLSLGVSFYGIIKHAMPKWWKVVIVLQIVVILLLRSRAVYLSLFLSCLLLFYAYMVKSDKNRKLTKNVIIWALVILILCLLGFYFLGGNIAQIQQFLPEKYKAAGSGVERIFVWFKTLKLIGSHWITGCGVGNWKLIFPSLSIEGAFRLQSQNVIFTRVHNDFLEVFCETGIVGIIAYLGMFVMGMKALIVSFKNTENNHRLLSAILMGTLGGYMVIAFFDFPKERFEHQILLSFLFAIIAFENRDFFNQKTKLSITFPTSSMRLFRAAMILLLMINIPLIYYNFKGENHTLKSMKAQSSKNWKLVQKESELAYNKFFYQVNPTSSSPKWLEGLAYYQQGDYVSAEKAFEIAFKETPYHFQTVNDYGSCLAQLKKFEKSIEIFKRTLFINPKFEDAMFNISYAYAFLNQFDQAYLWVEKTKLNPQKKADFIVAIDKMKTAYLQKNIKPI